MEVDTRAGQRDGASATELQTARLHLSYLKSYTNMGTALVDCVSGCSCDPQSFTTLWEVKQSILKVHIYEVGAAVPGCLSLRTGGGWWHVHLLSLIMLLPPALKPKIPQQCAGVPAPTLPVASHHCRRGWAGSAGSAQGASALRTAADSAAASIGAAGATLPTCTVTWLPAGNACGSDGHTLLRATRCCVWSGGKLRHQHGCTFGSSPGTPARVPASMGNPD